MGISIQYLHRSLVLIIDPPPPPPTPDRQKKIQVKHNLGRSLYGGQGQHKIEGAHLGHVGIAMHA